MLLEPVGEAVVHVQLDEAGLQVLLGEVVLLEQLVEAVLAVQQDEAEQQPPEFAMHCTVGIKICF